nr:hypothetical protein GCM10020093_009020 [Planobispora longispora]
MREPDRHGLLGLQPAVGAHGDVGGDLDGAAVEVEEAEAVPAAGVSIFPGSEISRTPAARSRSARASTSAGAAAPKAIRSRRFSSAWRSRMMYCSGEPSAARNEMPPSLATSVRPQTPE